MVRRKLLLITLAVLVAGPLFPGVAAAADGTCGSAGRYSGGCPPVSADITQGTVELGTRGTQPGQGQSQRPGSDGTRVVDAQGPTLPPPPPGAARCIESWTCAAPGEPAAPPQPAGRGPITWADLAAFRPSAATLRMEPNGWMVLGLPTNYYLSAGVNVQSGTLLGAPASVRFTPAGYRWSYGDGASSTTGTPGSSWAAAGLPEFSTTATSHVYDEAGTYQPSAEVNWAAEYTLDGVTWVPVEGSLPLPAPPLSGVTTDPSTVLVARDCIRNTSAPGC